MAIYVIRHGSAGRRGEHSLPSDLDRPLDERGRKHADTVDELLADRDIARILSSPAVRCVETVAPLAKRLDLEIELEAALLEGQSIDGAVELVKSLATAGDTVALCSHAAIIPDTIAALADQGMTIVGPWLWSKGSTWQLTTKGAEIVSAESLGPFQTD